MDSISCKRFRRFENLEPLNFKGVNFFVGANNSGKSTVVKAILLLKDNYFKSFGIDPGNKMPLFDLTYQYAHIGDFNRAYRRGGEKSDEEQSIEIEWTEFDTSFKIVLCKSTLDTMYACYQSVEIHRTDIELHVFVDFKNHTFSYSIGDIENKKEDAFYDSLNEKYNEYRLLDQSFLGERLHAPLSSRISSEVFDEQKLEEKRKKRAAFKKQMDLKEKQLDELIGDYFSGKKNYLARQFSFSLEKEDSGKMIILEDQRLQGVLRIIDSALWDDACYFDGFNMIGPRRPTIWSPFVRKRGRKYINMLNPVYLYAHNVHQNSVFSILDKNDHIALAIHEYYKCFVRNKKKGNDFIDKWLEEFEIGTALNIKSIPGGELYTATVTTFSGINIPLQDLGMGAIQIVILLLHMAVIVYNNSNLVMIEEPEQNIHPKLQSKLADLFLYVHKESEAQLIIETHSEYMIRRTQYLMAEGGFDFNGKKVEVSSDDNPFQVYYFPKEGQPYPMVYQESGLFENKFGEGFFDESGNLLLPVINKARSLQ